MSRPSIAGIPATHHSCNRAVYRLLCGDLVVELLSILSIALALVFLYHSSDRSVDCLVVWLLIASYLLLSSLKRTSCISL
jgi:hypothetical protein